MQETDTKPLSQGHINNYSIFNIVVWILFVVFAFFYFYQLYEIKTAIGGSWGTLGVIFMAIPINIAYALFLTFSPVSVRYKIWFSLLAVVVYIIFLFGSPLEVLMPLTGTPLLLPLLFGFYKASTK